MLVSASRRPSTRIVIGSVPPATTRSGTVRAVNTGTPSVGIVNVTSAVLERTIESTRMVAMTVDVADAPASSSSKGASRSTDAAPSITSAFVAASSPMPCTSNVTTARRSGG